MSFKKGVRSQTEVLNWRLSKKAFLTMYWYLVGILQFNSGPPTGPTDDDTHETGPKAQEQTTPPDPTLNS